MILFIFEGKTSEPQLFHTIKELFFKRTMNVEKANFICKGVKGTPASKEDIVQPLIYDKQLKKYVNTHLCEVAVLNAFPIFLYDYFKSV